MNKALDAITDKVLAHQPSATPPLKVIAGEPDRPLVIGNVAISCYVLEDKMRVLTQRGVFTAFDTRRGGHHKAGAELPRFFGLESPCAAYYRGIEVGADYPDLVHSPEWSYRTWLPCYATPRHLRRDLVSPVRWRPNPPATRSR